MKTSFTKSFLAPGVGLLMARSANAQSLSASKSISSFESNIIDVTLGNVSFVSSRTFHAIHTYFNSKIQFNLSHMVTGVSVFQMTTEFGHTTKRVVINKIKTLSKVGFEKTPLKLI